jgi:hypothetical protein
MSALKQFNILEIYVDIYGTKMPSKSTEFLKLAQESKNILRLFGNF